MNNGSNTKQTFIDNNRFMALEQTAAKEMRGLNCFTGPILVLDSAVVKIQNVISSRGYFLTYAFNHQRETFKLIKIHCAVIKLNL